MRGRGHFVTPLVIDEAADSVGTRGTYLIYVCVYLRKQQARGAYEVVGSDGTRGILCVCVLVCVLSKKASSLMVISSGSILLYNIRSRQLGSIVF